MIWIYVPWLTPSFLQLTWTKAILPPIGHKYFSFVYEGKLKTLWGWTTECYTLWDPGLHLCLEAWGTPPPPAGILAEEVLDSLWPSLTFSLFYCREKPLLKSQCTSWQKRNEQACCLHSQDSLLQFLWYKTKQLFYISNFKPIFHMIQSFHSCNIP